MSLHVEEDGSVGAQDVHRWIQDLGWDFAGRRSKYPTKYTFDAGTREQFKLYVEMQESGSFNMMDLGAVEMESEFELTREIQKAIHKHYAELVGKYGK